MRKFVTEREIPAIGNMTPAQLQAVSLTSCSVLQEMGPKIQWIESCVTADKVYSVYIVP